MSIYQFDTTALGSMGFISLCAKSPKTHVLCTWVLEPLLGLLNPIDHLEAFEFDDSLFHVNNTVLYDKKHRKEMCLFSGEVL